MVQFVMSGLLSPYVQKCLSHDRAKELSTGLAPKSNWPSKSPVGLEMLCSLRAHLIAKNGTRFPAKGSGGLPFLVKTQGPEALSTPLLPADSALPKIC